MGIYEINNMGELIKDNTYVGRGIVIGKSADAKKAVTAYFIMGRSENSRNRVFIEDGDEIVIHPFDASKVEDPSLIIYSPIRIFENNLIVTNGDQTDTVYDFLKDGKTFEQALETREFEPDSPNWTPRISGMMTFADGNFSYKMSILKSADAEGTACNRYTFSYPSLAGLGHFIHTYNHDGNPIPTFTGEPERVAIPDDIDEFTSLIWENLNEQNKISLYVRYIDLETGKYDCRMINKNK
ncbi:MAG: IMP cyclohydrolase [Clostridia bacterium]|nr:IMP cyclohydrolase [Clostridia bacterium]MBR3819969.1 IMP cyclohydrolase [Clostridia bacterium]